MNWMTWNLHQDEGKILLLSTDKSVVTINSLHEDRKKCDKWQAIKINTKM